MVATLEYIVATPKTNSEKVVAAVSDIVHPVSLIIGNVFNSVQWDFIKFMTLPLLVRLCGPELLGDRRRGLPLDRLYKC